MWYIIVSARYLNCLAASRSFSSWMSVNRIRSMTFSSVTIPTTSFSPSKKKLSSLIWAEAEPDNRF